MGKLSLQDEQPRRNPVTPGEGGRTEREEREKDRDSLVDREDDKGSKPPLSVPPPPD